MVHESEGSQDQFWLHQTIFTPFQLLGKLLEKTYWLPQLLADHLDISKMSLNLDNPYPALLHQTHRTISLL